MSVLGLPALRDARVTNYVVQADVAARLHPVGCEEEGHARHVLHGVSPLVQNEALRAESAFVTEQEAESCGRTAGSRTDEKGKKKRHRKVKTNEETIEI